MEFSRISHSCQKGDFENPYPVKDLIDKFKSLNPDFDLNKLIVVDNIEEYSIKQLMETLNE